MCSNPDLAQRWRAARIGPVALVRRRTGRVSRMLAFLQPLLFGVRSGATLLVFDFYLLPLVVLLLPVLKLKRIRVVVDVHDSRRRNPRRAPYFRLMRFADAVVAISAYIAEQLESGPEIAVIPRPVVEKAPAPAGRLSPDDGEPVHVGVVGQITPDKGVDDVVRWFADAPSDMVLHVRGAGVADDGGFAHELVKTARRTLGDRFANDGLVERAAAVAGLDVLVVANPDETFGRTVIEAQLAGVVPLVPDTGGSSELVDPERTGLRYAAGDGASFAAALANLDLDRAMLRQISASAPGGARETADPERIRAAYAAVLRGGAR